MTICDFRHHIKLNVSLKRFPLISVTLKTMIFDSNYKTKTITNGDVAAIALRHKRNLMNSKPSKNFICHRLTILELIQF